MRSGLLSRSLVGHVRARLCMLPDDWRRDLLRSLESVQGRVNQILFKLAALASGRHVSGEPTGRSCASSEERLKEVVLMAESFIPRPPGGVFDGGADPAAELAIRLFDAASRRRKRHRAQLPEAAALCARSCRDRRPMRCAPSDELRRRSEDDKAVAETRRALLWLGQRDTSA